MHFNNGVSLVLDLSGRPESVETYALLEKAIEEFDNAISLAPDEGFFWSAKGYALRMGHRLPEAAENFEKAIALQPEVSEHVYQLCLCFFGHEMLEEGVEMFEEALNLSTDTVELKVRLGSDLLQIIQRFWYISADLSRMGYPAEAKILNQKAALLQDYSQKVGNSRERLKS